MNQKIITLGNASQVQISWETDLSNLTIEKDGVIVGVIDDRDVLKQGKSFILPDQQQITVVYTQYGLEVWQNGKELVSNAQSKSVEGFARAVSWLKWVGGIQFVFAPILYLIRDDETRIFEAGAMVFIGSLLLGLGFWAEKTGSKVPFWIGIVFCVGNIVLTIAGGSIAGIFITSFMLYYLFQGTKAEAPERVRRIFTDPNAPLDSGL